VIVWLPLLSLLVALAATGLLCRVLSRHAILDRPNARSSHTEPTPRGGGIAVIGVTAAAWSYAGLNRETGLILGLGLGLAALSWIDDLRGLSVRIRFPVQVLSVGIGLLALDPSQRVFQGVLPLTLDRVLAGLAWLWFLNLFNFMDGIDGISGTEASALGIGIALAAGAATGSLALFGLCLAGAAAGFLVWNWQPARIFLGDVGSIPLGFLLAWLLIALAARGQWAAALLLPLYYLADGTLTLVRRLARRERVWQAHREHFYQQAARRFGAHAPVALWVGALDLALIALAVLSTRWPLARLPALGLGFLLVALLLWHFARGEKRTAHAG
jgi:UDP-N-acetylmuramyl pentapeptide phosphotransferase/UDP-N-acetylglucosamine-1-phosphate transferase